MNPLAASRVMKRWRSATNLMDIILVASQALPHQFVPRTGYFWWLVPRKGFDPLISTLKGWRPNLARRPGHTRVFYYKLKPAANGSERLLPQSPRRSQRNKDYLLSAISAPSAVTLPPPPAATEALIGEAPRLAGFGESPYCVPMRENQRVNFLNRISSVGWGTHA